MTNFQKKKRRKREAVKEVVKGRTNYELLIANFLRVEIHLSYGGT